jgi:cytidine deaminase
VEKPAEFDSLLAAAQSVAKNAIAPHSDFQVGAAILDDNGQIHVGCNVENSSYGLTVCAERNAVGAMAAAGSRTIRCLVLFTPTDAPVTPCGACRQVLAEFGLSAPVYCACASGQVDSYLVSDLLPQAFRF